MTALLVAAETPFPPESGTRLRNVHLARRLAEQLDIEMVVLGPPGDAAGEPYPVAGVPHEVSRLRSLAGSRCAPTAPPSTTRRRSRATSPGAPRRSCRRRRCGSCPRRAPPGGP